MKLLLPKQPFILAHSIGTKRDVSSVESSRSVRGLGKSVSDKPYPRLCKARRLRLEPGTFQSQAVRLYRLHQTLHSIGTDLAKWSVCCTTNIGYILDGRNQIISIIILLLDGCYENTFAPQHTCWSNMLVAAQMHITMNKICWLHEILPTITSQCHHYCGLGLLKHEDPSPVAIYIKKKWSE